MGAGGSSGWWPGPVSTGSGAGGQGVLVAGEPGLFVATRYDKLAVRYEAVLVIASINEWLPRL
jgi:hypothetical protein